MRRGGGRTWERRSSSEGRKREETWMLGVAVRCEGQSRGYCRYPQMLRFGSRVEGLRTLGGPERRDEGGVDLASVILSAASFT